MLKTLVKKQMTEIFRAYFYDSKKNKARSKGAAMAYILVFVLLMVGILGGMFTFLSLALCAPMAAAGMDWLYFTLMGMMAVFLGAFGSIFNTYSTLYLAKDNDLLLSMPIPVNVLMASRLLTVYLMGLIYSGIVILPAIIVYWAMVSVSLGRVLGGLLFTLLISLFVLTLSCALGWVVAKISLKLKHKSMVTVVVSLLFMGGYYFLSFRAQQLITELVENSAIYGEKIRSAAYPLYLFGKAGTGDGFAMLVVSVAVFALLVVLWWMISRSFLKVATSSGRTERKVYKETIGKQKGTFRALLDKELGRFAASPNYILNCGLGTFILPLAGIVFLWKGGELLSMLNGLFADHPGTAAVLLCSAICLIASMNIMAAPSVSLEGGSLWLIQSLPVTPRQVLKAKLSLQLLLTGAPALFCVVCMAIVCSCTPVEILLVALQILSFVLLMAQFGLFLGLKMPNLSWTNEITVIKQSACVGITMLVEFLYSILPSAGFLLGGWKLGFVGYMSCFGLVTAALCAVLFVWLRKRGAALFAAL